MKIQIKNLPEVWQALDAGKTVHWINESYKVEAVPWHANNPKYTKRDNQCLRVTCISNGFGSLLEANEVQKLFYKQVEGK